MERKKADESPEEAAVAVWEWALPPRSGTERSRTAPGLAGRPSRVRVQRGPVAWDVLGVRVSLPTRAGAGPRAGLHRPASRRSLTLRLASVKLNYNGCDYNDISPPRSSGLDVKGSVLERVQGAAIHTRQLTVL